MLKPAAKRSACDQCRTKRVRCLRPQESTVPCARCSYTGEQCVTGLPGHPGRPPRHRSAVFSDGSHRIRVHGQPTAMSRSAATTDPSRKSGNYEPQSNLWTPPGNNSSFFYSPPTSTDQSTTTGEGIPSPVEQSGDSSQLQGILSAESELNALLQIEEDPSINLSLCMDSFLGGGDDIPAPAALPQCTNAVSSMVAFRDEIEGRIATIDEYFANSSTVLQNCKDESENRDVSNPAALLLSCSKDFTDIIQSLVAKDVPSTEIVLLALSTYLALMRLFDSLFHRIYECICQLPPESYQSIKVKSVLRIGSFSSLQDMPLRAYAVGILDAIQSQVRILERAMGIPAEYSLSCETRFPNPEATPGMFSSPHRAQLFRTVMAQEDIKSRRGSRSYVDSVRTSIKDTMAFLHD